MGFSAVIEMSIKDNPASQMVTLLIPKWLSYLAGAVGNGLEALKALENAKYHLVLMDSDDARHG
jgi:CheY-like chemotaxis protein